LSDALETWQVHGLGGELIAEYSANASASSPQKEYGYRNGQLLVTATVTSGWGSAPVLHDNPLVVSETTVQARHITELRDAINALRSHLNMSPYSWQYSVTTNDWVTANPILEMRIALDQALGAPTNGYASGLATDQLVMAVHIQELRDRVLAAWTSGSSTQIQWLVSDQLGTPRMIFDQNGSLANVSRHDYLPFGEELFSGTGGRTSGQGYTLSDKVRQKFTQKERDNETGLDYFLARYYSSMRGRFTSPDEFRGGPRELFVLGSGDPKKQALPYAELTEPQSLNKYQYCYNNPLRYIDPDGHRIRYLDGQTEEERREARGRLMADLAKNERKYFTIKYDKNTHEYTLALKGDVNKALSQNHTAAFAHLVETVRATATLRLGIASTFSDKSGTSYTTADGQQAHGRYTDCWAKQNGNWLAVSAHVSR